MLGFLPGLLADRLGVSAEAGSLLTSGVVAVNILGDLAGGALLAKGVPHRLVLRATFVMPSVTGFASPAGGVPGWVGYASSIAFSVAGGLVADGAVRRRPVHALRSALVGATVGLMMQGNNLGLVVGPAIAGALAASAGWSTVGALVMVAALAAGLSGTTFLSPPPRPAARLGGRRGRPAALGPALR